MNHKIKISTHSPFQKLEAVLIGQGVDKNFFNFINDEKIRVPLNRIVKETNEDLENIKKVCEQFGAKVFQSKPLEYKEEFFKNSSAVPVPPIQPRDVHLTLGDKVYCTSTEKVWHYINDIVDENCVINLFDLAYNDGGSYKGGEMLNGASCYKVGSRIIIPNIVDETIRNFSVNFFKNLGYEVIITTDQGHSDGIMSVLKPGVIISLMDSVNYRKSFPNWEVLYIKDQSWSKLTPWLNFKAKSKGRWWVPGEESNEFLLKFVDTWLNKWVGYVEETVFDVNMFSLSEEVVLVNNYNKEVFDFLKKHKIEPVICPFRHRYFWDGGLHCLTLDLKRQGERENYF